MVLETWRERDREKVIEKDILMGMREIKEVNWKKVREGERGRK